MNLFKRLAFLSLVLILGTPAAAQYYGGGNKIHGHTSNTDGGRITNLSILGTLTAPKVIASTFTASSQTVTNLSASTGTINQLFTTTATATNLNATNATLSNLSVTNASIPGAYILVCSTVSTVAMSISNCSGLPGVGAYRVIVDIYGGTNGIIYLTFNNDASGGAYKYVSNARAVITGVRGIGLNSATNWNISNGEGITGEVFFSDISFTTSIATSIAIRGVWNSSFLNTAGNMETVQGAGWYNGGAIISSIQVGLTVGTGAYRIRVFWKP